MAPRAPTAYFLFAGEHRAAIHAEIAAANNGKASVALVGKAIGEKWKELTEEQKQSYKDRAAEKAKELKEQLAAAGGGENDAAADGGDDGEAGPSNAPPPPLPFGFPTSLIKKIACMDPDVDRMAGDAVKVLSKATALFVELLAAKSYNHATTLKRKNFKFSDIETVAKKDRRLGDMGLPEMFEKDAAFEEVRTKIAEEAQNKLAGGGGGGRGRKKADATPTGEDGAEGDDAGKKKQRKEKPLTAFFGVKPAAVNGDGQHEEEDEQEEEQEEEEEAAVPMAEGLEDEQLDNEAEEEEEEQEIEAEDEADQEDPLEEDEDAADAEIEDDDDDDGN